MPTQCGGSVRQTGIALNAATIGIITYRYTRRQSALALTDQNNTLANLLNRTITDSQQAREA